MDSMHKVLIACLLAGASHLSWAQQGPDELWEMSMSMEMEGMSMPAMNQKICQKKGENQESRTPPVEKDCKLVDSRRSGNKQTFKFACDGKDGKYTVIGETESLGKDAYRGNMKSSGVREGEKFDMSTAFSGKRAGNCTWEDPAKKANDMMAQNQAQVNAMMAKECGAQIEKLDPTMFFGGAGLSPEALICKDRKADFCANTAKVAKTMRDPAGFTAMSDKHQNWREAMTACGTDPSTISGPSCKSGMDKKDWNFVNKYCKTESAALRKAHCAGRNYTTVDATYREMCSSLGGLSYTADTPSAANARPQEAGAAAKPQGAGDAPKPATTTDKLKEGAGKLKKFLKF
ncbi:MAG: DUF3617 family protein [Burkholderiales bacterium]